MDPIILVPPDCWPTYETCLGCHTPGQVGCSGYIQQPVQREATADYASAFPLIAAVALAVVGKAIRVWMRQ